MKKLQESSKAVVMEVAGITLAKADLVGIKKAHKLSQVTIKNIRQNLFCV